MSVLPRPMARGMIKHVVIVFGGIYGNLVEPSLTNMARALVMTAPMFEYWTWPADRWKSCKFKRLYVVLLSTLVPKLLILWGVHLEWHVFY